MAELHPRTREWARTMTGFAGPDGVHAHAGPGAKLRPEPPVLREEREAREAGTLVAGATLASGAENRAVAEEPDA